MTGENSQENDSAHSNEDASGDLSEENSEDDEMELNLIELIQE